MDNEALVVPLRLRDFVPNRTLPRRPIAGETRALSRLCSVAPRPAARLVTRLNATPRGTLCMNDFQFEIMRTRRYGCVLKTKHNGAPVVLLHMRDFVPNRTSPWRPIAGETRALPWR